MKALVLSEYKRLEMADLPQPRPAADELLIRIQACGICGSDVHGYDGSTGRRLPPIVMGHEAAGIVAEVGDAVDNFSAGDRVTFDSTVYCGNCFFCRRGEINLCDRREVIGVSTPAFRRMGAFAEFVTVPARIAYRLPDSMPFAHAALIEAVSVAVHAVALTPIKLNDTAVVVGAGMIGLLTLQAARLAGAGAVFVLDVDQSRLEMARGLGATRTFNSTQSGCDGADFGADQWTRRGCSPGVRGHFRHGKAGAGQRAQRRERNAGGQCCADGGAGAAIGGDAADPAARLVRIIGRVSGLHCADVARGDSRGAADLGGCAA